MSGLVSLLSGRNFETKTFEEAIAEKSFAQLRVEVEQFSNETNFKRFIMIHRNSRSRFDALLPQFNERLPLQFVNGVERFKKPLATGR